ncbi:MAG: hypothetical protein K2G32_06670, partial [Oscillospiraceae bacterium]|nr:hypothetical protein [Oscillospiraceae bacterium]
QESSESDIEEYVTVLLEDKGQIVTVSRRDYIVGCLAGMISPKCEREALKAAAACVSSTAQYYRARRGVFSYSGADLSDKLPGLPYITPEEAAELHGEKYLSKFAEAAENAPPLTYNGEPIFAAVCEISSGCTDSAADVLGNDFPYLVSVPTELDAECEGYDSVFSFTEQNVYSALSPLCEPVLTADCSAWFDNAVYYDSGTLKSISFGGCEISGAELRSALGLRSASISVEYSEDRFRFSCRGYGDNLGMSLNYANELALRGNSAEDILKYFYHGIDEQE